jgi:hypothetical protein
MPRMRQLTVSFDSLACRRNWAVGVLEMERVVAYISAECRS